MINKENLKPFENAEEAREKGKKGGKASVEARRKKRAMREAAEIILSVKPPLKASDKKAFENLGIEASEINVQFVSLMAAAKKAMKGDLAALAFLRDTAGERPKESIGLNLEPVVIVDVLPDEEPEDEPEEETDA